MSPARLGQRLVPGASRGEFQYNASARNKTQNAGRSARLQALVRRGPGRAVRREIVGRRRAQ